MAPFLRTGLAFSVAVALTAPASAGINRWTRSGPQGATVNALAIDAAAPTVVYAGVGRGRPAVWKSASSAASWAPAAALGDATVLQLETDPVFSGTVFAVTGSNSLYRSRDGGGSWQAIGPGRIVLALAVARTLDGTGSVLYLGTDADLWKSVDGGNAWSRTNLSNGIVTILAAAPKDPRIVLAVAQGTPMRSADGGATWQTIPDPRLQFVRSFWIHPRSPVVYAALVSGETRQVVRSDDAGLTWAASAGNALGKSVLSMAFDPDNPLIAIIGTPLGLSRTDDGGGSWRLFGDLGVNTVVSALRVDPSDASTLYAGTDPSGVFRSRDGGQTWLLSNHGLALTDVTVLAGGSQPVPRLYASANGCGLLRSEDGGRTWPCVNTNLNASFLTVDPTESATVYARAGSTYSRSFDAGLQFTPILQFTGSGAPPWLPSLPSSGAGGGGTITLAIGGPPTTIYFVNLVCTKPRMIFCDGIIIPIYGVATVGRTIQVSPPPISITTIAADPSNPNTLVAGGDKIVRSTDSGATWNLVDGPAKVSAVLFDRLHPGRVYAGAGNGVWMSADSGATWTPFGDGLDGSPVAALVIDDDGLRLHAAVHDGGVYNYDIGAPSATLVPASDRALTVTLSAHDPRTGRTAQGLAAQRPGVSANFVLPDITGDWENPEVFVKAADGRPLNGSLWFFYGGLTDLEYTIQVTESATGRVRSYTKPAYESCGGADTLAFPASSGVSAVPVRVGQATTDAPAGCAPGSLCLSPGRDFALQLTARDQRTGRSAVGKPTTVLDTFGFFSLPVLTGDSSNPEVFAKILDATAFDGQYWLLYGALTDLEYTLTVIDVATGLRRDYTQPPGGLCGGFDAFKLPPR